MPESQLHGFAWENEIKRCVFNVDSPVGYTETHDVPKELNRFNSNENISIKTTGSSTLCMGDPLRIFDYPGDSVHTGIVVHYEQVEGEKRLVRTHEITLDNRVLLWGSVTREEIAALDGLVRSMPRGARVPDIDEAINRLKTELNGKSGVMRFNPKIDSKTQRRLQCSIPNYESTVGLIRITNEAPVVRDIVITSTIESSRRIRNRRV